MDVRRDIGGGGKNSEWQWSPQSNILQVSRGSSRNRKVVPFWACRSKGGRARSEASAVAFFRLLNVI